MTIRSRVATEEYRREWERVFGRRNGKSAALAAIVADTPPEQLGHVLKHLCGMRGFDPWKGDTCPACPEHPEAD